MLVGDSLTQDGQFGELLRLYVATRFPDRGILLLNAGIAGDGTAGALRRYDWDIAPRQPSAATIMFGMNDVGRHLYATTTPDAETLAKRETTLATFRTNLTQLVTRLQADGVDVTLVTPTPYDDTSTQDSENLPACNSGLAVLSTITREVAATAGVPVIDLHTPLTALNHERQKTAPAYTLIGRDRVHPGTDGHASIARLLLEGLGAPPVVSHVKIDADSLRTSATNAEVNGLTRVGAGLRFNVQAAALPFPAAPAFAKSLALAGFLEALSHETLHVTSLPPGDYRLTIGTENIGTYTAADLAAGLRLDQVASTPQQRQAGEVAQLVHRLDERIRRGQRIPAQVEHTMLREQTPPVRFDDVAGIIREKFATLPTQDCYEGRVLAIYLEEKPREAATAAEIESLLAEITEAARPRELAYTLTPSGPSALTNRLPVDPETTTAR
jgi:lysophospholipase L1-like esterase